MLAGPSARIITQVHHQMMHKNLMITTRWRLENLAAGARPGSQETRSTTQSMNSSTLLKVKPTLACASDLK